MTESAMEAILDAAARGLFLPGDRLVEAEIAPDPAVSVAADRAFHAAILGFGGNAVLLDMWRVLAARFSVLWGIAHRHRARPTSAAEHEAILSAIEADDTAAAGEALTKHLSWYHEFDCEAAIAANRRAAR